MLEKSFIYHSEDVVDILKHFNLEHQLDTMGVGPMSMAMAIAMILSISLPRVVVTGKSECFRLGQ